MTPPPMTTTRNESPFSTGVLYGLLGAVTAVAAISMFMPGTVRALSTIARDSGRSIATPLLVTPATGSKSAVEMPWSSDELEK